MTRFLAWFRWEWRDHHRLVVGSAVATVFLSWILVMVAGKHLERMHLEAAMAGELMLAALVLASGLFGSERRHGADSLLLRMPGARVPLFAARLAFFATALGFVAFVASLGAAFLAARVTPADVSLDRGAIGPLLWPRWILADVLVLVAAVAAVTLLVSAWTQRVAVGFVLGIVAPVVLLFPWIYLGATRPDFLPLDRMGVMPMAAWPLLVLALIALGFSWLLGRRHLNRPWRAVTSGAIVLALGLALAGGFTAQAFSSFDTLDAEDPGFRLAAMPVDRLGRGGITPYGHSLSSVALTPDGRGLWVQGFRRDRGSWPLGVHASYGKYAQDFREQRGTFSRQWRIDLETGEAQSRGDVRERITWYDIGSGAFHGLLRGVDTRAFLAPRGHALFGQPGHPEDARGLDLLAGADAPSHGLWGEGTFARFSRKIAASGTGVLGPDGTPAWLEVETPRSAQGRIVSGPRRVFLSTAKGRTEILDEAVRRYTDHFGSSWLAIRGGWALRRNAHPHFITIEAATGTVRMSTDAQVRAVRMRRHNYTIYLGVRQALVPVETSVTDGNRWPYTVLDLEKHTSTPSVDGPPPNMIVPLDRDGRLLALDVTETGRRLIWWTPATGKSEAATLRGAPMGFPATSYLSVHGGDRRGNFVFLVHEIRASDGSRPDRHLDRVSTFYVRAATGTVHSLGIAALSGETPSALAPAVALHLAQPHVVGIDAQDRVVSLGKHDGNGYRAVLRYDPEDRSTTVLFPKRERGPAKER